MPDRNLLFVCVDCLRQDFVGTDHADTPFVDGLVASGTDYRNLFATATTTTPAVSSFMTGTYSERNGVYSLEEARLNERVTTLAERLSAAGYETAALTTGPLVADTGLDRGFDTYDHRDRREELVGPWFEEARDTLDGLEEPFFLYLHLWEIHTPVRVPDGYDDPQYGEWPYARALSALDRSLESFVDALPSNTVVALHGDHGESVRWRDSYLQKAVKFLRTGLRYGLGLDTRALERRIKRRVHDGSLPHDHFIEDAHGENVFDFVSNVPFVLSGPGVDACTVDAQCRQVDVYPTLLDLLGVDYPGEDIHGESLLPAGDVTDRDVYMRACGKALVREKNWQRAVRADGRKYVEYPNRDWASELYDLAEDPAELDPYEDDTVAARMRRRMPSREVQSGEKLEIDDLLEDLGYK